MATGLLKFTAIVLSKPSRLTVSQRLPSEVGSVKPALQIRISSPTGKRIIMDTEIIELM